MPILGWTESVPSGTSSVGVEPAHLHSLWTAISLGLSTDLYWDGSGGASAASRGELRPGASRTYVGPQSASSNSNAATQLARAFFCSDTSRLFVYDSTGTFLGGTPYCLQYRAVVGGLVNDPPRAISGSTTVSNVTTASTNSVGVCGLPLTGSVHARPLAAYVSCSDRSVLVRAIINRSVVPNTSSLILEYRGTAGAASTTTFYWHVITPSATGAI